MIHGVDTIQIPMPRDKEEDARSFYGGILGLRELSRASGLGRSAGISYALPDGRQLYLSADDDFRPHRKNQLTLSVNDLEVLDDQLGKAGHRTEWDFGDDRPRFYCQDPFGNRLQVVTGTP